MNLYKLVAHAIPSLGRSGLPSPSGRNPDFMSASMALGKRHRDNDGQNRKRPRGEFSTASVGKVLPRTTPDKFLSSVWSPYQDQEKKFRPSRRSGKSDVSRSLIPKLYEDSIIQLGKEKVGLGGQGIIRAAYLDKEGNIVVKNADPRTIRRELAIAKLLGYHPHIAHSLGADKKHTSLFLRKALGSVDKIGKDIVKFVASADLDVTNVLAGFVCLLRQFCLGLDHIHVKGIVHLDVSLKNFLLLPPEGFSDNIFSSSDTWRVQICDFGVSHYVDASLAKINRPVGTFSTMAPEILLALPDSKRALGQPSQKSDVFSLGCVFLQLLTGKTWWDYYGVSPIKGTDSQGAIKDLCSMLEDQMNLTKNQQKFKSDVKLQSSIIQEILNEVVYPCLNIVPEARPTLSEVIKRFDDLINKHRFSDNSLKLGAAKESGLAGLLERAKNNEYVSTSDLPTKVLSAEVFRPELLSTKILTAEFFGPELLSTKVLPAEVFSTEVLSTEVLSPVDKSTK